MSKLNIAGTQNLTEKEVTELEKKLTKFVEENPTLICQDDISVSLSKGKTKLLCNYHHLAGFKVQAQPEESE